MPDQTKDCITDPGKLLELRARSIGVPEVRETPDLAGRKSGLFRKKTKRQPQSGLCGHICINCGNGFTGKYCNVCGQYYDQPRLTFKTSAATFIQNITNFDRGIPHTLKMLFTRPGAMIRDFLQGKRVNYAKPLSMLIVLCTIYAMLQTIMLFSMGEESGENAGTLIGLGDHEKNTAIKFVEMVVQWGISKIQIVLPLVMLPFYALFTKLLFRRNGAKEFNYTEIIYICIFIASQTVIFNLAMLPAYWISGDLESSAFLWIEVLGQIALTCFTLRQLFKISWFKSAWKSTLMILLSYLSAVILFVGAMVLVILLSYGPSVFSGTYD